MALSTQAKFILYLMFSGILSFVLGISAELKKVSNLVHMILLSNDFPFSEVDEYTRYF